jgi:hypothetical protein
MARWAMLVPLEVSREGREIILEDEEVTRGVRLFCFVVWVQWGCRLWLGRNYEMQRRHRLQRVGVRRHVVLG